MSWIVTASGREIDFTDLVRAPFHLPDMLHSLSRLQRFTGHGSMPYSVLDHSVNCFWAALDEGYSPDAALACLCHDLHEAYIGDISTPVKLMVPQLKVFERQVEEAVHDALGITPLMQTHKNVVKFIDTSILLTERNEMIPWKTPWPMDSTHRPLDVWLAQSGMFDLNPSDYFYSAVNAYEEMSKKAAPSPLKVQ